MNDLSTPLVKSLYFAPFSGAKSVNVKNSSWQTIASLIKLETMPWPQLEKKSRCDKTAIKSH